MTAVDSGPALGLGGVNADIPFPGLHLGIEEHFQSLFSHYSYLLSIEELPLPQGFARGVMSLLALELPPKVLTSQASPELKASRPLW